MKVITLWQPWASFIAFGWKSIETRTHNKFESLKGNRIAIHAGKNWDKDWWILTADYLDLDQKRKIDLMKIENKIPFDKIICSCFVKDYKIPLTNEDEIKALIECKTTRAGLILTDVVEFHTPTTPVKEKHLTAKGSPAEKICHQGIWNYDL